MALVPHPVAVPAGVRIDLVYNPASGQFRQSRLEELAQALALQGFIPNLVRTHPDALCLSRHCELVCVFGGDGTVRMTAQALGERIDAVPLAVFAAGTVNLIARELGCVTDPRLFARNLAEAWRKGPSGWLRSPMLSCGRLPVMACLSIGPDSAAVAEVSPWLKERLGRIAYVAAAARLLWRWPRASFAISAIRADGSPLETLAQAVFVSRSRFYAGPFRLSRKAWLASDDFELILLPRAGRLASLCFALCIMLRLQPEKLGLARLYSVRSARIAAADSPVQVDGDAAAGGELEIGFAGHTARFCV